MAGITQTIPNFNGGISQQPDDRKFPGQVTDMVNAIPDVVQGLYKRPGSQRISGAKLSSVGAGACKWFHYYRDETEGSYIGQVLVDGSINMWRCSDGYKMTVSYGLGGETAIKNYLKCNDGSSTGPANNIEALTINDSTFLSNRDTTNSSTLVATTGTTDSSPDSARAYVDILRTENGRQYALNVYDSTTQNRVTINSATRIKINYDNLDETDGTGTCPSIGTQVFSGAETNKSGKKNLTVRITTTGQQGLSPNYVPMDNDTVSDNDADRYRTPPAGVDIHDVADGNQTHPDGQNYRCTYNKQVELLFGGEGWSSDGSGDETNDLSMDSAQTAANYKIRVTEHESITHSANIAACRPTPTPFDADTAVTIDSVLGGIVGEINNVNNMSATVIGTGIYFTRSSGNFNIEVLDNDLMRVMQEEVNDVSKLPLQCKHGYIVKISNTRAADEDDYYVKFQGDNGRDGPGSWVECAKGGIEKSFNASTMPVVLQRTSATEFTVKQWTWADREVGDNVTNPIPSFVGRRVNKVAFFRNRLAFLSGENVICGRPGTLAEPNFWSDTALTISPIDPVDIASSSLYPSDLFNAVEMNAGLVCFSTNQQFLLSSDAETFDPNTGNLKPISSYNYAKAVGPISLGTSIGFLDNSNKFTRFNEVIAVSRESEPIVSDTTIVVPTLLPKDLNLFTNSRENRLVFFGKTDSDTVFGFKYINTGAGERTQGAWFKWKLNNPITYHFCVNDEYYFLDSDDFLQKINILQADTDPSITQDDVNYLVHLDNWTTISGGSYSATTNLTTFSSVSWLSDVTTPNGTLVVIDTDSGATRLGRYAECTVDGTTFTVPGDWSSATLNIGYLYEYSVKFPRFYRKQLQGQQLSTDVSGSLIIHRLKLNFGKVGVYETTLTRVGKDAYTELYESNPADDYDVSDAPYLSEDIKTIPVYEKNTNVAVTVKSSHPAPAALRSCSWEGDYSPLNYRRV